MFVVSSALVAPSYSGDLFRTTIGPILKTSANSGNWFWGTINVNHSGRAIALAASLLSALGIGVLLPHQKTGVPLQTASCTRGSSGAPTLTIKSSPTPSLGVYHTSYSVLNLFLAVMVCATVAGSVGSLYFAGRSTLSSSPVTPPAAGEITNRRTSGAGHRRHNNPSSWPTPPRRPPGDQDSSFTSDRIRKGPYKCSGRQKPGRGDEPPPPPPGAGMDGLLVNPDEFRDFIFGMLVIGALFGWLMKKLKGILPYIYTKQPPLAKRESGNFRLSENIGQAHTIPRIMEPLLPPSRVWPGVSPGILDSPALLTYLSLISFVTFLVFFRFRTRLHRGHPSQVEQHNTTIGSDLPAVMFIDRHRSATPQYIYKFGNSNTPPRTYRTLPPTSNQRTAMPANEATPSRGVLSSSQSFTAGTPERARSRRWDRVRVSDVEQVKYFYQDEIIGFGNGPPRGTRHRRANSVS